MNLGVDHAERRGDRTAVWYVCRICGERFEDPNAALAHADTHQLKLIEGDSQSQGG